MVCMIVLFMTQVSVLNVLYVDNRWVHDCVLMPRVGLLMSNEPVMASEYNVPLFSEVSLVYCVIITLFVLSLL